MIRAICSALLLLVTFGCDSEPVSRSRQDLSRVYTHTAEVARPQYIPDKSKRVESVSVGRILSSGIGDAADGGAWAIVSYAYGRVTFDDGTVKEHEPISLVYDNWSGKLVAVESH